MMPFTIKPSMSSSSPAPRHVHLFLLLCILALGAALRFTALGEGIPFAVGVDEPEIMERAVRMMKTGDFHPYFFDYPGLYIYIQFLTACLRFVVGGIGGAWASLNEVGTADFYLWGRAVTATFGTLTVLLVYRGASRISPLAGLLSAAIFAVQSMHVRESHFVLTDVPTTFFVALTWVLALRAQEHHTLRAFFWTGVAAGLAAATKYNGGVAVLLPMLVLLIGAGDWSWKLRALATVVIGAGVAFLAGAPYTVLALPEFLDAFANLSYMYAVGSPPPEPGWLIYFKHLRLNFSMPGLLVAGAGLGLAARALWSRRRATATSCWAMTASFAVIYFWMISGQRLTYGRYLLPLLPFLSVLAGGALATGLEMLHARQMRPARVAALAAGLLLAVCWTPAANSVATVLDARKVSTAEQTYQWILDHVPPRARIGIETRGILLNPDQFEVENFVRLIYKDFAGYQADGFEYLVASSQSFGAPIYTDPPQSGTAMQYRELFGRLEPLVTFVPDRDHPGAEWRVFRVPTP